MNISVPSTVPLDKKKVFAERYKKATQDSDKLFIFAADHKIEHLNKDFWGKGISDEAAHPEHLFKIASKGKVGLLATQLGLIARYGKKYNDVNYLVKINSRTNLVGAEVSDPQSMSLCDVSDVVALSDVSIVGVAYTIYLGSKFEAHMLSEASRMVLSAHKEGLLAVLWVYPRGCAVKDERSASIVAGATGLANALGADFVKVHPPKAVSLRKSSEDLIQAVQAAGNTGVICSGGIFVEQDVFLEALHKQIYVGGAVGCAIGRNIFQRSLSDAVDLCKAIRAVVYDNASVKEALALCN